MYGSVAGLLLRWFRRMAVNSINKDIFDEAVNDVYAVMYITVYRRCSMAKCLLRACTTFSVVASTSLRV